MSPFERHDENLRDLQQGGSGQRAPEGDDPPQSGTRGGENAGGENAGGENAGGENAGGENAETPEELAEELEQDEISRLAAKAPAGEASHGPGPVRRLYRGETSFDFVGRRRWWFLLSTVIIVAGAFSLGFRGLNLGIDFKGGTAWIVKTSSLSQTQVESLASAAGLSLPTVEVLGHGGTRTIEVQADLNSLPTAQQQKVSAAVETALARAAKVPRTSVSVTHVGPTWGGQVTQRAFEALIVFFIVVAAYISFRFEPKMALAAFIAMVHDLLVTIGVYSLAGFQVTPDTVIAVLTILGYSLYDTVVVFDRVRDNTKGFGASGRMTYSEMINLSMNQTLARSVNTSLVAILPVLSVLLIGAELLGATTLQDYGLALTIGLLSGAYSSIFIASPVLAMLKEREPRYASIRQRLQTRGDRIGLLTPAAAAALAGAGGTGGGGARTTRASGNGARAGSARAGSARPGAVRPGAARSGAKVGAASTAGSGRGGTVGGAGTAETVAAGSKPAAAAGASRPRPAGASGARRPPPRPRKGGGKGRKRR